MSDQLIRQLAIDPALMNQLSPDAFEELICDRLFAMGLEPKRVGAINQRDGAIDILFWPRAAAAFPFLGAAQVKHHREPTKSEGPKNLREFAGALAGHAIHAGLFVTNTSFTPDATWFAQRTASVVRLRDFSDVSRWLKDDFGEEEWREIPREIEVCPGFIVKLR